MSNPETVLLQNLRLELAKIPGVILYRNPIGHDGRAHVDYGIQNPGGSDLIGLCHGGRFVAIEVKTASGAVSPEQRNFIAVIRRNGGLAGVARTLADCKDILNGIIRD